MLSPLKKLNGLWFFGMVLGLFSLSRVALAQSIVRMEVTGSVPVENHSAAELNNLAREQAFQRALLTLIAREISGPVLEENRAVVEEKILANSDFYVVSHVPIDQKRQGDEFVVRLTAEIQKDVLLKDLEKLGILTRQTFLESGNSSDIVIEQPGQYKHVVALRKALQNECPGVAAVQIFSLSAKKVTLRVARKPGVSSETVLKCLNDYPFQGRHLAKVRRVGEDHLEVVF